MFARTGSTNSMFPGTSQEGATCDVMFVQSVVDVCVHVFSIRLADKLMIMHIFFFTFFFFWGGVSQCFVM